MTRLTLILLLISIVAHGQVRDNDYSDIIPKDITVKHLPDSINFVDNTLRRSIIEYLKSKKLDPSKYFVDSTIQSRDDTLYIQLWDFDGLKRLKEIEKRNKKEENLLVGNPGKCGTIYYDSAKQKIIGFYFWQ